MKSAPIKFIVSLGLPILAIGCVIIPVDYHPPGVRRNISMKTESRLEEGATTKSEVFLLLGEPDHISEDGKRIGYAWTKVKAIVVWASYGGSGGAEEIKRSYILEIRFDASEKVSSTRVIKDWGSEVQPAKENE